MDDGGSRGQNLHTYKDYEEVLNDSYEKRMKPLHIFFNEREESWPRTTKDKEKTQ